MMKDTTARFVASAATFSGVAFTPRFAKAFSAAFVFHISNTQTKFRIAQHVRETRAGTVAAAGMLTVDLLETDVVCRIRSPGI